MMDRPLSLKESMFWGLVGLGMFFGLWSLLSVSAH